MTRSNKDSGQDFPDEYNDSYGHNDSNKYNDSNKHIDSNRNNNSGVNNTVNDSSINDTVNSSRNNKPVNNSSTNKSVNNSSTNKSVNDNNVNDSNLYDKNNINGDWDLTGERIAGMTIKELKEFFSLRQPVPEVLTLLKDDSRKGVQQLAVRLEKRQQRRDRLRQDWEQREAYCDKLRNQGYNLICGLDEAGRGPLAGPVAAGAVILPADCYLPGLDDSKKLSAARREELAAQIQEIALDWEVILVSSSRIDEINILQATCQAMETALARLQMEPHYLLLDGELELSIPIPQEKVIDGDARINAIAAASILAKVTRDTLMEGYHQQYPQYNFASNKGYGTAEHIAALEKHGPSPIHRHSFAVVAENAQN